MDQSSQIDAAVTRVMRNMTTTNPLVESQVRADLTLGIKYPGQYVVYTDLYRNGKLKRIVHVATRSLREANEKISSLPEELRDDVQLTSVDDGSSVAVGLHAVA